MAKITAEHLRLLFNYNVLKFECEPDGNAPVCRIKDRWFYFAGEQGELDGADEYLAMMPLHCLLSEASDAIDGWDNDPTYQLEHAYYASVVSDTLAKRIEDLYALMTSMQRIKTILTKTPQDPDITQHDIAACDISWDMAYKKRLQFLKDKEAFDNEVNQSLDEDTGPRCPVCYAVPETNKLDWDFAEDIAWFRFTCPTCGTHYTNVYKFQHTDNDDSDE